MKMIRKFKGKNLPKRNTKREDDDAKISSFVILTIIAVLEKITGKLNLNIFRNQFIPL
jgi:hypothetical protein